MGRVQGKKASVTGAAQGLGAAQARMSAREGAKVSSTDINGAGAAAQAEAINAESGAGTAFAIRHDVTSPDDWDAAIASAGEASGGLSVSVNNAGVGVRGNIETCTSEDGRGGVAIKVDRVCSGGRKAVPSSKGDRPGSMVNISSIAGSIG
ncbi:hypothetical protein OY671_007486 [Metschnikowia pulcherrima]|nr:hypothetical protein OY671_007486 [Metschnikowia pulcherrima]